MISIKQALPAAAATSALLITAAAAKRGVPAWERRTYQAINNLPDAAAPFVWPPMQFGSFPSPLVLGAVVHWRSRRSEPAVSIVAAGFTAWIAAKGVKKLVGRGRPHDFDSETHLRLGTATDGSLGFVSGHTAVAVASAGIIHRYSSAPLAACAYGLAAIVGLSRIYAGAHLPIDVLGGAALGVLVAEGITASRPLRRPDAAT